MASLRAFASRIPRIGTSLGALRTASQQGSRSIFVSAPQPLIRSLAGQWARASQRRFTTAPTYFSSFWAKGGLMTAGGLALAGWKAATATESSGPLGLAVVECEAPAVEVDVNKLVEPKKAKDESSIATVLTLGGFLGFSTGYFFKKIGKVLLFFVGAGFVFIQYLVHKDFVKVNWDVVSDRFYRRFDRDRDGKVSTKDVGSVFGRLIRFLTYQVPFAAGFTSGFYIGFRYG